MVIVSILKGDPRASGTPNSPAHETKTRIAPDRMDGVARGSVTRQVVRSRLDPLVRADSSSAGSIRRNDPITKRYITGVKNRASTQMIPPRLYTLNGSPAAPNRVRAQPLSMPTRGAAR